MTKRTLMSSGRILGLEAQMIGCTVRNRAQATARSVRSWPLIISCPQNCLHSTETEARDLEEHTSEIPPFLKIMFNEALRQGRQLTKPSANPKSKLVSSIVWLSEDCRVWDSTLRTAQLVRHLKVGRAAMKNMNSLPSFYRMLRANQRGMYAVVYFPSG